MGVRIAALYKRSGVNQHVAHIRDLNAHLLELLGNRGQAYGGWAHINTALISAEVHGKSNKSNFSHNH
jgi:hypothetical protein